MPWWSRPDDEDRPRAADRRALIAEIAAEAVVVLTIAWWIAAGALIWATLRSSRRARRIAYVAIGAAAFTVAVVCSFNYDEPIEEILSAAAQLPDVRFYMTGDPRKLQKRPSPPIPSPRGRSNVRRPRSRRMPWSLSSRIHGCAALRVTMRAPRGEARTAAGDAASSILHPCMPEPTRRSRAHRGTADGRLGAARRRRRDRPSVPA